MSTRQAQGAMWMWASGFHSVLVTVIMFFKDMIMLVAENMYQGSSGIVPCLGLTLLTLLFVVLSCSLPSSEPPSMQET